MGFFLLDFISDKFISYLIYGIVSIIIYCILSFIYRNFIRKRMNLKARYGNNSWALVTGATDGLGRSYCEELAREGFNIIMVSRTLEKLKKVADEIQKEFKGIKVDYIEFDFDKRYTLEEYKLVFGDLSKKYDISILVNNVGFYEEGLFGNLGIEVHRKHINLNIIPQTVLTKIFSESFTKRSSRSAVIDLSSFASFSPIPFSAMYCATKNYNYYLSRALAEEWQNYNIDFLVVRLVFAETNMSKKKADGFIVVTPKQCVNGVLNDLGYEKETCGYWSHKIQFFIINLCPRFLLFLVMRIQLKFSKLKTE